MEFWKMKDYYKLQPWFEANSVFLLNKINEEMFFPSFGTDCEWKNISTGEIINNWDNVFRKLTPNECREFQLSQLGV